MSYDPFPPLHGIYKMRKDKSTDGEKFDRDLATAIAGIGKGYRAGKQPPINTPMDRLAYAIQYAPIGIAAMQKLTWKLTNKHLPRSLSVLWDKPLSVLSIGAGPGTDLFGFLYGLAVPPFGLRFTRADIGTKWKTYYEAFLKDFASQNDSFGTLIDNMDNGFIEMDLSTEFLWTEKEEAAIRNSDIITINRVLSVFSDQTDQIHDLLRIIAANASPDTLIFLLDVSLPKRQFQNTAALAEGICRLEKKNSEWLVSLREMSIEHFGWTIPSDFIALEKYGYKIARSGRLMGGVLWLKE